MNEKKVRTVLLVVVAIAILIGLMGFLKSGGKNRKLLAKDKYIFSSYKFDVPNNLKFFDYDEDHFKIEGNGWYAIVSLFYDSARTMDDVEKIYNNIKGSIDNNTKNVAVNSVNGKDVLVFSLYEEKYVLCYFGTNWNYEYEVQIYNDDHGYNIDALYSIMDSLQNAEH